MLEIRCVLLPHYYIKIIQKLANNKINQFTNYVNKFFVNKTENPLVACNINVVFANALGVKKYKSLNF